MWIHYKDNKGCGTCGYLTSLRHYSSNDACVTILNHGLRCIYHKIPTILINMCNDWIDMSIFAPQLVLGVDEECGTT